MRNALIYRRVYQLPQGQWLIEERWDVDHPDCPPEIARRNIVGLMAFTAGVRQRVLTDEEYRAQSKHLAPRPRHAASSTGKTPMPQRQR